MKEIILTQGKIALVDDEDFTHLNAFKWCAVRSRSTFYAVRQVREGFKYKFQYMHRVILGLSDGSAKGEHRDGNGLNNQRSNLRTATSSQNQANRGANRRNTSGYKGVSWCSQTGKWRAHITADGVAISLGYFSSKQDAARVYDNAAIQHFGSFASLNSPEITQSV